MNKETEKPQSCCLPVSPKSKTSGVGIILVVSQMTVCVLGSLYKRSGLSLHPRSSKPQVIHPGWLVVCKLFSLAVPSWKLESLPAQGLLSPFLSLTYPFLPWTSLSSLKVLNLSPTSQNIAVSFPTFVWWAELFTFFSSSQLSHQPNPFCYLAHPDIFHFNNHI